MTPSIPPAVASTTPAEIPLPSLKGPPKAADARQPKAADARQPDATSRRTLRVLHVVNGEHFSGAERVQSHLGRCLPKFGVHADFASVKPGRFTERLEAQAGAWGDSHRIPMRSRIDAVAAKHLIRCIRQHRFDLLHAHTPRTALLASLASTRTGVPWIYHVHSPASRDSSRGFVNRVNAWIEKRSLRNADAIITVSNSLRDDCVSQGYRASRIFVVHNGVPAICPPRTRIPQPDDRWTLGMVALMRPRKGLEIVLDSVASLRAQGFNIILRCIGPFETTAYGDEIDQRIQHLGIGRSVQQMGFVDDVPAALAKLDAMVLPSLYGEGLPMVVLEAMAAGLPVIASRVEGTPEAIGHDTEGLLAEPADVESLSHQIRRLVTGEVQWSALSEAAKRRHSEQFSDLAMAKATADVYFGTRVAGLRQKPEGTA
ncbi:MAG: glycosyltransferase [Planctomycetota bacterium]